MIKILSKSLARMVDKADSSSVGQTQSNVGPLKHMVLNFFKNQIPILTFN